MPSAEIIVIALGTVSEASFGRQLVVLGTLAAPMTIGVYGLVACIIKLDDVGPYFSLLQGERPGQRLRRVMGRGILKFAPWLMRGLSFAGTFVARLEMDWPQSGQERRSTLPNWGPPR